MNIATHVDYAKLHWYWRSHHERFARRVEHSKLVCQECRGMGGWVEPILDDGTGPREECGWCEGTGRVTPFLRGQWLMYKRSVVRNAREFMSLSAYRQDIEESWKTIEMALWPVGELPNRSCN